MNQLRWKNIILIFVWFHLWICFERYGHVVLSKMG